MPSFWQITARAAVGSQTTVSQLPAAGAANGGQQIRLRSITASLVGTAAGTATLVVRDGATGVGTIIWQVDLSIPANGSALLFESTDVRASIGNALTVEFTGGVVSGTEAISAQGDFVPIGFPLGQI